MGKIRILKASAGSGKTFSLAYQYIRSVIDSPLAYREILAVTFTNKATEEMKQRIVKELHTLSVGGNSPYFGMLTADLGIDKPTIQRNAQSAQSRILHDYSRFSVLTIDKFFQRVIRSFIKELGIDLNFNIELQTTGILQKAVDALIEQTTSNKELRDWIIEYIDERLESGAKWDVSEQLAELGKEIFKEEFKSSPLTKDQIAQKINSIAQISLKATNFMKQKADEIIAIAEKNDLTVDDFANKSSGVYSYVLRVSAGDFSPPGKRAIAVVQGDANWYSGKKPKKPILLELNDEFTSLLCEIYNTYSHNEIFIFSYDILKKNYRAFALLNDLYKNISEIYKEQNVIHISETNRILSELIAGNDTPFIFEKVGARFSEFMIDEFQDTSLSQWQNFLPLLHNALSCSDKMPVMLVGDVKQSIYRWRGGDWQILGHQAAQEFKENAFLDNLKVNYRSKKMVIDFNNAMIDSIVLLDNERLNERLDSSLSSYKDMLKEAYCSHQQACKNDEQEGYVNVTIYNKEDEKQPKPLIIQKIEQMQNRGYNAGDIAILVRKNSEANDLASMLLKYKGENPSSPYSYDVVTAEALNIGKSRDVNFIISVLRLSADTSNLINRAIVNRFLGFDSDAVLSEEHEQFLLKIRTYSPLEAFEEVIRHFSVNENSLELAYIQALHGQIISYCNNNIADISEFVNWWEKKGCEQSINIAQSKSAINIITIHKSKGLEFKCVIIPYCNWEMSPKSNKLKWVESPSENLLDLGSFPVSWSDKLQHSFFSESYLKEEVLSHIDNVNTFYVAATRAECELHIMLPKGKRASSGKIDSLIIDALQIDNGEPKLSGLKCSYTNDEQNEWQICEFGKPSEQSHEQIAKPVVFEGYPSRAMNVRENLRQKTQRYYQQDELPAKFSPRNHGILMHRLFENAKDLDGIMSCGEKMLQDALINEQELSQLKTMVDGAMQNPLIKSWFDTSWDDVKNENEIILPDNQRIKRPDRVMIKGDKAVVVDYKFGLQQTKSHQRQVAQYANLLSQMGYKQTECYLWYVSLGEVEKVQI